MLSNPNYQLEVSCYCAESKPLPAPRKVHPQANVDRYILFRYKPPYRCFETSALIVNEGTDFPQTAEESGAGRAGPLLSP